MRLSVLLVLSVLLATAALSGCGNSRTPVPNASAPAPAKGFRMVTLSAAHIAVEAPQSWALATGRAPLVAVISSGNAVIALWRYARSAAVPAGTAPIDQLEHSLIARARARDPGIEVLSAQVLRMSGFPAVQLEAVEHIAGQLRMVRSTHLFLANTELVLDEYAPPRFFGAVDHTVFVPVAHSLVVTPPAA